jgi:hypothetical protein
MIARTLLRVVSTLVVLVLGSRTAEASSCHERSESRAVGYANCSHFGMWDQDRLSGEISLAFTVHRLSLDDRTFAFCGPGKACPPTTIGGDTSTKGAGVATIYGPSIGMLLDYGPFRFGPRMDFGWGAGSRAFVAPGIAPGDSAIFYGDFGFQLGARASLWHIVLGADVFTGVSETTVIFDNLVAGSSAPQRASGQEAARFAFNPEVSALAYLHPYIGLGFAAGGDLASQKEMHASFVIRLPLDPYEGTR